jgi:hypothetical protein
MVVHPLRRGTDVERFLALDVAQRQVRENCPTNYHDEPDRAHLSRRIRWRVLLAMRSSFAAEVFS